jgi:hypothetical protein
MAWKKHGDGPRCSYQIGGTIEVRMFARCNYQVFERLDTWSHAGAESMNGFRNYDAWKTATPPEYEEYCEECGYGRCKCDEIERGDEMRDRWKDEEKGR